MSWCSESQTNGSGAQQTRDKGTDGLSPELPLPICVPEAAIIFLEGKHTLLQEMRLATEKHWCFQCFNSSLSALFHHTPAWISSLAISCKGKHHKLTCSCKKKDFCSDLHFEKCIYIHRKFCPFNFNSRFWRDRI